ncbi:MAG: aspartate ammonia-lyase [Oscillospiraceae bacterium]|nr:aspartate ammonia-lyase [Oscillospiraceae bacterium]
MFRIERDSIGEKQVPREAYYGVQSLRAFENFKITGRCVHPELIRAIAEIKRACAMANSSVGALDKKIADAIISACDEICEGKLCDQFIVDAVQGGAGTSMNMNANEVVSNRAIELLGREKGDYSVVHPNDHANCGQSTNDVFPTSGKIAAIRLFKRAKEALSGLRSSLLAKAEEFSDVVKMGRTEMQDAVPLTLGAEFAAFAAAIARDIKRFDTAIAELSVVNMGGTAVGTGITADPAYIKKIVPTLASVTGLSLTQADDLIDGTQNLDCFVIASGIVKACAVNLSKMANDLRLMSSGPRTGFGEINLPPKQNGSSIMPGKINPVIPEVMSQISYNIIGNDTTITLSAEAGQLELNANEPIIFYCLFESIETLTQGVLAMKNECVDGISANREKCADDVAKSMSIVTALCPYIGYTKSAELAKRAMREGKRIREVVLEEGIFDEEKLDEILNPFNMIQ